MKSSNIGCRAATIIWAALLSSLFFTTRSLAANEPVVEDAHIFPQHELFPPIIADQRAYIFSVAYERRKQGGRSFSTAEVSLGDSLPLKDFALTEDSKLQLTFDGVVYSLYDLNSTSDDLVNSDYLVGASAVYRYNDFAVRLQLRHKSSHLGDEYLLDHPDVERDNLSFEEVRLLPAYNWNEWRVFAGIGSIFRSNDSVDRLNWEGGLEYVLPSSSPGVAYFFASDILSEARSNWRINQSYRAGISLGEHDAREIRFSVNYVLGYAQDGQFTSESSDYYGFAIYFQL